jgi:hypothetical protein
MPAIASIPVFAASIVARLPLAMLTIGMLVHVQHVTGSFAAAGLVSGALAVALKELLGQRARQCGRPRVSQ